MHVAIEECSAAPDDEFVDFVVIEHIYALAFGFCWMRCTFNLCLRE